MKEYGDAKCQSCKAMLHVDKCEKEEAIKHRVDEMKEKSGTQKKEAPPGDQSWSSLAKTILMKPYPWIFASILVFSPYGVDILKTLAQIFGK